MYGDQKPLNYRHWLYTLVFNNNWDTAGKGNMKLTYYGSKTAQNLSQLPVRSTVPVYQKCDTGTRHC